MRPAVHVRPERLRAHSAAAVELAGSLQAALAARPPGGPADLGVALRRAAGELAELGAVLAATAAAAESADGAAAAALRRASRS